jgi:L-asparagine transporter-like permease
MTVTVTKERKPRLTLVISVPASAAPFVYLWILMEFCLVWLQNLTDDREPNLTTRQLEVRVCVCASLFSSSSVFVCLSVENGHPAPSLKCVLFLSCCLFVCLCLVRERREREREMKKGKEEIK